MTVYSITSKSKMRRKNQVGDGLDRQLQMGAVQDEGVPGLICDILPPALRTLEEGSGWYYRIAFREIALTKFSLSLALALGEAGFQRILGIIPHAARIAFRAVEPNSANVRRAMLPTACEVWSHASASTAVPSLPNHTC